MICTTVKNGVDCPLMTARGCGYTGGSCHPVVEQCNGCKRVNEYDSGLYCTACPEPAVKWKNGNCNLASHVTAAETGAKTKINPLKASKRARR